MEHTDHTDRATRMVGDYARRYCDCHNGTTWCGWHVLSAYSDGTDWGLRYTAMRHVLLADGLADDYDVHAAAERYADEERRPPGFPPPAKSVPMTLLITDEDDNILLAF